MALSLKKIIISSLNLKIAAVLFGYALWSVIALDRTIEREISIPLTFYNQAADMTIQAPEYVHVSLLGKKRVLDMLDTQRLAVHIDASQCTIGQQPLLLENKYLFLPDTIKLVHYKPLPLTVVVTRQTEA